MVRGMALSAAAAVANGKAVPTEMREWVVRVFIGTHSADVQLEGLDVDFVMSDRPTWQAVERRIGNALAQLSS